MSTINSVEPIGITNLNTALQLITFYLLWIWWIFVFTRIDNSESFEHDCLVNVKFQFIACQQQCSDKVSSNLNLSPCKKIATKTWKKATRNESLPWMFQTDYLWKRCFYYFQLCKHWRTADFTSKPAQSVVLCLLCFVWNILLVDSIETIQFICKHALFCTHTDWLQCICFLFSEPTENGQNIALFSQLDRKNTL